MERSHPCNKRQRRCYSNPTPIRCPTCGAQFACNILLKSRADVQQSSLRHKVVLSAYITGKSFLFASFANPAYGLTAPSPGPGAPPLPVGLTMTVQFHGSLAPAPPNSKLNVGCIPHPFGCGQCDRLSYGVRTKVLAPAKHDSSTTSNDIVMPAFVTDGGSTRGSTRRLAASSIDPTVTQITISVVVHLECK